jgi:excisionase family DNA binding protein
MGSPDTIESGKELSMEDRWLSVEEISVYLGVTKDTVYKWLSEKKLPAHKVGRLWKFKKEDVDVWVKAQSNSQEKR